MPHASLHVTRIGTPRLTTVARRWRVKERIEADGGREVGEVRLARREHRHEAPGVPVAGTTMTGWMVVVVVPGSVVGGGSGARRCR